VAVGFPFVDVTPLVAGLDRAPAEMLLLLGGKGNSSGGGIGRMLVLPSSEFLSMIGTVEPGSLQVLCAGDSCSIIDRGCGETN